MSEVPLQGYLEDVALGPLGSLDAPVASLIRNTPPPRTTIWPTVGS